jgi:hypothetical protein
LLKYKEPLVRELVPGVCPKCHTQMVEVLTPFRLEYRVGERVSGTISEWQCPCCGHHEHTSEPAQKVVDPDEECPDCGHEMAWEEAEREVGNQCLLVTVHHCPYCG